METKQACSGTSSDVFLAMLCCSGASWAKASAMIFNSFSFSFPGIYPVINNSIRLKLFFEKKIYAATVTLEMLQLCCLTGVHDSIIYKRREFWNRSFAFSK